MIILDALQSVFTIFIMIGLGYYLTHKRWFNEEISNLFSKIVNTYSLPAFMISNLTINFDKEKLSQAGAGILVPFISMVITYTLSIWLSNIMNIKAERKGVFRAAFALSNTIFIGLPVNISLFGDTSVPYVLLYYVANTTIFWSVGVYGIRKDASSDNSKLLDLASLKKIFNPSIISLIFTIAVILLNIKLPKCILDSCKYIGNLTTPLSLLFIGIVLYNIKLNEIKLDKDMLTVLSGRFIVAPIIIILLLHYTSIPILMKKVFVMQSAMPVMTQTAIVAKAYNSDHKYAAILGTVSTIASLLFIPIYMIVFSHF